jgi:isopentenyl-diphosphate delta-isomerase
VKGDGEPFSRIKDIHIEVCLHREVEASRANGFEDVQLLPGFPTFSRKDIDTTADFLGRKLSLPLLISPITGGGRQSARINRNLATAAEHLGIAMAVGSERPMLERRVPSDSYLVRDCAPTVPLVANLGLVHAKRGSDYLREAVTAIGADAITLYVNPLHEILQEEGENDFDGALEALGQILPDFPYPVLLKEVGTGLPASILAWAGKSKVAGVDVAGLGGTNWARIEGIIQGRDYSAYEGLGTRTLDALLIARGCLRGDQWLIASGGLRTGVDMAKAYALGSGIVSMALPFVRWANVSSDEVVRGVERLKEELVVAMWFSGARTIAELKGKTDH